MEPPRPLRNAENDKADVLDRDSILHVLKTMENEPLLDRIRITAAQLKKLSESSSWDSMPDPGISKQHLESDLNQIIEAYSIERTKYYIHRLVKSMTVVRRTSYNDINLNRWKEYDDILTDSLWIEKSRDRGHGHNADYWGNFIPQIPNQMIRRFTREGDWILDTFSGSGTTLLECMKLSRNGIGLDISSEAVEIARKNLRNVERGGSSMTVEVVNADSTRANFSDILGRFGVSKVQFVMMHPPYWDIIKFSRDENDLSNATSIEGFLLGIRKVASEAYRILEKGRFLALVIGDKYSDGEWIPLGFKCMNALMEEHFTLKSIIVKNFDSTRGKQNKKDLWRYRALLGGFYVFKHEYIFLFQR